MAMLPPCKRAIDCSIQSVGTILRIMEKIRVWNSKILADGYVVLEQMAARIADIVEKTEATSLSDLPNSMIPTLTLYEIAVGYSLMYEKLLEYDLLNTGNIKQSSTIH